MDTKTFIYIYNNNNNVGLKLFVGAEDCRRSGRMDLENIISVRFLCLCVGFVSFYPSDLNLSH